MGRCVPRKVGACGLIQACDCNALLMRTLRKGSLAQSIHLVLEKLMRRQERMMYPMQLD